MKSFSIPEMEIMRFRVDDIITTSDLRDDEFPIMPVGGDEFPISEID